jgi:3-dehydroquinate synthase
MVAGLYFSLKRGSITEAEFEAAQELITYFDLPVRAEGFNCEDIFNQMFYDKKTKDGKLNIVILDKLGKAYTEKNVKDDEVKAAIAYIAE